MGHLPRAGPGPASRPRPNAAATTSVLPSLNYTPQASMSFVFPNSGDSRLCQSVPALRSRTTLAKRFICPVCSQRFRRAGSLAVHQRVLHPWTVRPDGTIIPGRGELPFECKECHKRFAHREQYFAHKKLHTGAQVMECPKCSKRMLVRRTSSKHARVHVSSYPPFDCVCGRRFKTEEALAEHLEPREVHRPFKCVCGHKFRQQVCIKVRDDVRDSALVHMSDVGRRWTKISFS